MARMARIRGALCALVLCAIAWAGASRLWQTPVYAQDEGEQTVYLPLIVKPGEEESGTAGGSITLNGDSIVFTGAGALVSGSSITITEAGAYTITGSLTDGQVIVDTDDAEDVVLTLAGVDIASATSAPLVITNAEQAVIVLADGTQNRLTDAATYVYANAEEDEPDAALFSTADLEIRGNGSLTVNGNYLDGIASKDGLRITGGVITVNAVDDGIRGRDYVIIEDGALTLNTGADGLKATNDEDAAKGYILVQGGALVVAAAGDAMQAETAVTIDGGTFTLAAGGGSQAVVSADDSAKGIKGTLSVTINGGVFAIDVAEDGIHSDGSIVINGGQMTLATGDDAIHANGSITVNGGSITITKSYEGIESAAITLNNGTIRVVASDDGINAAGDTAGTYTLAVNGGFIVVDAGGDGLDINGSLAMTSGTVIVNGPTQQGNGAIDYDGSFGLSGGFLVAAGSSGMAQAPSSSSSQYSVLVNLGSTQPAGTLFRIQTTAGENILTFAPGKAYQSVALSSDALALGQSYQVWVGGSASGESVDGLYTDPAYTPGSQVAGFTISAIVTVVGGGGGTPPGPRP